jgi:hypothetical protein
MTLVPGAALHELVDQLTHAHATLAFHAHVAVSSQVVDAPTALTNFVVHGLTDGVSGQALGFPLLVLAMWGLRRPAASRPRVADK